MSAKLNVLRFLLGMLIVNVGSGILEGPYSHMRCICFTLSLDSESDGLRLSLLIKNRMSFDIFYLYSFVLTGISHTHCQA